MLLNEQCMPMKLVLKHAYQAEVVYQLRGLDTGAAREISGVVRVSRGGAFGDDDDGHGDGEEVEGGEWLYQWKGDGSVRLWSRGA